MMHGISKHLIAVLRLLPVLMIFMLPGCMVSDDPLSPGSAFFKKKIESEHSKENLKKLIKITNFSGAGSLQDYVVFNYTDNKLISNDTYDGNNVLQKKVVYVYADNGTYSQTMEYGGNNLLTCYIVYAYNSLANWTETRKYSAGDNLLERTEYTYNADGYWATSTLRGGNGAVQFIYTYEYSNKLIRKISVYNANYDLLCYSTYEQNNDGNTARVKAYSGGDALDYYVIYEYNERKQPAKISTFSPGDVLQKYSVYEYWQASQ